MSRDRCIALVVAVLLATAGPVSRARAQEPEPNPGAPPPALAADPADPVVPPLSVQAEPSDPPLPVPDDTTSPRIPPLSEPPPTAKSTRTPLLPETDPPPRDDQVTPAQAVPPAQPAAPAPGPATPYLLDPSNLAIGPQSVAVSVQVVAPPAMMLHKPTTVTVLVRNTGATDAHGVEVRYELPQGIKYIRSQPEATAAPAGEGTSGPVVWNLETLPANTEKQLKVTVEPTQKGPQDHTATVRLATGSRAKSVVQQPILRVEQVVDRSSVLKNQQVRFDITIHNDGDGPARGVLVRADLSPGLRHETEGQILELDIASQYRKPIIQPGETITLEPLIVDAIGEGDQTSTVKVLSEDVVGDPPQAVSTKAVKVIAPVLKLTLEGSKLRYTDMDGVYTITVENLGTAPAQDVQLWATLVGDGRPYTSKGASWDSANRRYVWSIPQLEQGKSQTYSFKVRYGGLGTFQVNSQVVARGGLREVKSFSTQIEGSALLDLAVSEDLRVLDVGQETVFRIDIKNLGTKEARKILIRAKLKDNMEATKTAGTDVNAQTDPGRTEVVFPEIDRLAPGNTMPLYIRAKAKTAGIATCHVYLSHDELGEGERLEDVATVKVQDTTLK